MEEEIWKDIDGFSGYYQISNFGRVKSRDRFLIRKDGKRLPISETILKPMINRFGYYKVRLYGQSFTRTKYIHVLVAEAFLEKPKDGVYLVCHNDGDKLNNHVDNLRYGTKADNYKDMVKHGVAYLGEATKSNKLTETQIKEIRLNPNHLTQNELATLYNVSQQQISRIIRKENWKWMEE